MAVQLRRLQVLGRRDRRRVREQGLPLQEAVRRGARLCPAGWGQGADLRQVPRRRRDLA